MAPLKFLGFNGFNPYFYQTYWHIVYDEVTSVVIRYLNDGILDSCTNFFYIALIPKTKYLVYVIDFRTINLVMLFIN